MANGTDDSMGIWIEVAVFILSGVAVVFSTLTRIAWGTKLDRDDVLVMLDVRDKALKEAFGEQLKAHRELMEANLKRIEEGTAYTNRAIDNITRILESRQAYVFPKGRGGT